MEAFARTVRLVTGGVGWTPAEATVQLERRDGSGCFESLLRVGRWDPETGTLDIQGPDRLTDEVELSVTCGRRLFVTSLHVSAPMGMLNGRTIPCLAHPSREQVRIDWAVVNRATDTFSSWASSRPSTVLLDLTALRLAVEEGAYLFVQGEKRQRALGVPSWRTSPSWVNGQMAILLALYQAVSARCTELMDAAPDRDRRHYDDVRSSAEVELALANEAVEAARRR